MRPFEATQRNPPETVEEAWAQLRMLLASIPPDSPAHARLAECLVILEREFMKE